jgi:hypothetical protein
VRRPAISAALLLLALTGHGWGQIVTRGLPNLAAGAVVTTSSAVGNPGEKYGPGDITDGKLDTWWAANNRLPQWFQVKLAAPRSLARDRRHQDPVIVIADSPRHPAQVLEGPPVELPRHLGARMIEGLHEHRVRVRQHQHEEVDLPQVSAAVH